MDKGIDIFFKPTLLAHPRGTFWPRNFDQGLCLHGEYDQNKIAPLKNFNWKYRIFTNQNMIEVIVQNYNKTKGPRKKVDKTRFEVHVLRMVKYLSTLIWVLRKQLQFGGQFC